MPKGGFVEDTFEKLAELGVTTAKKTVKQTAKALNPLQALDKTTEGAHTESVTQKTKEQDKKDNHTPVDFENLQKKYKNKDTQEQEAVRQRLFQLVKEGEKDELERKKREEQEKEREELQEDQQKKRQVEEQRIQDSQEAPRGKQKRGLFAPKQKAQEKHAELKPNSSKG